MIPKIIHYCWFGGAELPDLVKKCIQSWKKFCPDYEIKEWNKSNYDISTKPFYVQQAYEQRKWAFVSDYARFDMLYQYGGVYFDTDVELIRSIDDIISKGSFMACEEDGMEELDLSNSQITKVNPGLGIAVAPGLGICKEILDTYQGENFICPDGQKHIVTIVERTTDVLIRHGLKNTAGIQEFAGITVYPKEYFCPMDYHTRIIRKTKNTRAIHWYDASWFSEEMQEDYRLKVKEKRKQDVKDRIRRLVGEDFYEKVKRLLHK